MPAAEQTVTHAFEFQRPENLATEVARHLREQIINGELVDGERVNETRIMRQLGLSRSPVREALRILEAEGLVTLDPHRGTHVRTLSEDDLREIFDVRLMFETYALRAASSRLSAATIVPLRDAACDARAALAVGAMEPWQRASLRFHDGLVALAGNTHLQRLYADLTVSLRRYQVLIGLPQQPPRSQAEHESIVTALDRGDIDRAVDEVNAHITSLKERLLKRMTDP